MLSYIAAKTSKSYALWAVRHHARRLANIAAEARGARLATLPEWREDEEEEEKEFSPMTAKVITFEQVLANTTPEGYSRTLTWCTARRVLVKLPAAAADMQPQRVRISKARMARLAAASKKKPVKLAKKPAAKAPIDMRPLQRVPISVKKTSPSPPLRVATSKPASTKAIPVKAATVAAKATVASKPSSEMAASLVRKVTLAAAAAAGLLRGLLSLCHQLC
jgi:hypothetical protein